ncbi:MAG: hypothetical protein JXP34_21890 [Planctomycetes bacterium]|nr:hypothetical protein [Planctomycetota bacterium]
MDPRRTVGIALALCVAHFTAGAPRALSASPVEKGEMKVRPRTMADYLRGVWEGRADVEKGFMQGSDMIWEFTFPKGDFSEARIRVQSKPSRIQLRAAALKSRSFSFNVFYDHTRDFEMRVQCEGRLDPSFTELSGSFAACFGTGSFLLKKRVAGPKPEQLAGRWIGLATPARAKTADPPLPFSLSFPEGTFVPPPSCNFLSADEFPVSDVRLSVYDETDRRMDLCLLYYDRRSKKLEPIHLQGVFDEGFTSWRGQYVSRRTGGGRFELTRAQPAGSGGGSAP